jgi:hypothetical protein
MCDVSRNIRLRMWLDPCGEIVSFAMCSDAKKKVGGGGESERINIVLKILKFTVSINSHLNQIIVTLNVIDAVNLCIAQGHVMVISNKRSMNLRRIIPLFKLTIRNFSHCNTIIKRNSAELF